MIQRYRTLQRQRRWRGEADWGTVKEKRLVCQVNEGVCEGEGTKDSSQTSKLLVQPPNIPHSLLDTSYLPKQGCSGWDQDGEEEVMGCTPAGRGLKICSQGQWLQSQKESQNFHPRPSTIPQYPPAFLKQV